MLRPVAAGLMCLGFVTLGVAAFAGQDEERTLNGDVIAVDEEQGVASGDGLLQVGAGDARTLEVRIGDDGRAVVAGDGENKRFELREGGEVRILNEKDGRIVQRIHGAPPHDMKFVQTQFAGGPVIDPGTREAVEKLIGGLKEEAKRLADEGKKEEAEKKLQSIQALEQMLNAGPRWGAHFAHPEVPGGVTARGFARFGGEGPAAEEMKALHAALDELHAKAAKASQEGEGHAKLLEEIAKIHKQIEERHQKMIMLHPGAGPFPPGAPGAPMPPFAPGRSFSMGTLAGNKKFAFDWKGPAVEAEALAQKAAALTQAAAQLKQAGLEDQSRELFNQAEKLRAESEMIRAKQIQHGPAGMAFAGGPLPELQRSIHELQEQVQQLRKEVAELREQLQRRQ